MLSCCNNAPHCSLQPTPRCAALPAQRRSRIPPISGFCCRCGKHQGRCVEIEFWQCLQSCDAATVGGVPGAVVVAARWRRAARREARRRRLCLWPHHAALGHGPHRHDQGGGDAGYRNAAGRGLCDCSGRRADNVVEFKVAQDAGWAGASACPGPHHPCRAEARLRGGFGPGWQKRVKRRAPSSDTC